MTILRVRVRVRVRCFVRVRVLRFDECCSYEYANAAVLILGRNGVLDTTAWVTGQD